MTRLLSATMYGVVCHRFLAKNLLRCLIDFGTAKNNNWMMIIVIVIIMHRLVALHSILVNLLISEHKLR
jgi:hypothetical protein